MNEQLRPGGKERLKPRDTPNVSPLAHAEGSDWDAEAQALTNSAEKLEMRINNLEAEAEEDPLTGLLNRRGFLRRSEGVLRGLAQSRRREDVTRQVGLIFADVDDLKRMNTVLGREGTDEVLRAFASNLRANVRESDLVARWAGDEFALLIVDGDAAQLGRIAEKLRDGIEKLGIRVDGKPTTMSFGVVAMELTDRVTDVVDRAGKALQEAKNKGKNRVEIVSTKSDDLR